MTYKSIFFRFFLISIGIVWVVTLSRCMNYNVNGIIQPITVVGDYYNNRVLIYYKYPPQTGQAADLVLGQPDMNSVQANQGLANPTSQTLFRAAIFVYGSKLIVAEYHNNRVLIWNSIPTVNDQPADVVLGQPDFVSNAANNGNGAVASAQSLSGPQSLCVDGLGRLMIADVINSRVLIFNEIPTQNFQAADLVLGHTNFSSSSANDGGGISNYAFNSGGLYLACDSSHAIITDYTNNRVLVYESLPLVSGQAADVVLGQPNMNSGTLNNGGLNAQGLRAPAGPTLNGQLLLVADTTNNRVLIWNSIPTVNQQAANLVIGQPNFTTATCSHTQSSMCSPFGQYVNGSMLMVGDQTNSRILIWNSFPTVNGQPANMVLGQTNFTNNSSSAGATGLWGAFTMYTTWGSSGLAQPGGY